MNVANVWFLINEEPVQVWDNVSDVPNVGDWIYRRPAGTRMIVRERLWDQQSPPYLVVYLKCDE